MAAGLDVEIERTVDLRPRVLSLDGDLGQGAGNVEDGKRIRRRLDGGSCGSDGCGELIERRELDAERAFGRARNLGFELTQLGGRETHLSGERLTMDEGRVERGRQQSVAMLCGHLDEIAKHVVVPDLER